MKDLKYYSELVSKLLEKRNFYTHKDVLRSIFRNTSQIYSKTSILSRLTFLDIVYSTQMNKRYYGLEALSEKIFETFNNDQSAIESFKEFAKNPVEGKVLNLFDSNYGIHMNGNNAGKAISLISKYAYFLTDYQFPIYDSIVKEMYPKVVAKYYPELQNESINLDKIESFVSAINSLNQISKIHNYDKLDSLLWLTGKINEGNISLILNRNEYEEISKSLSLKELLAESTKNVKEEKARDKNSKAKTIKVNSIFKERIIHGKCELKDSRINDFCEFVRSIQ